MSTYSDRRSYPAIVGICCVNSVAVVTPSHMNILRKQIYEVVTSLYIVDGKSKNSLDMCITYYSHAVRYKPGKEDNAESADLLLQLMVPESYLNLQEAIKKKIIEMKENEKPPILKVEEFL